MPDSIVVESLRRKFDLLLPLMNERMRRIWAAAEAIEIGWGGVFTVISATGLSHNTIDQGIRELKEGVSPDVLEIPFGRVRRVGGGRKPITQHDTSLLRDLESLVDPSTRGDPQSALRWTCKSIRKLAEELKQEGHRIGYRTVATLLRGLNYSLRSNRKTREGTSNPDRNAQFEYINAQVCRFQKRGQPVVSVDSQNKELVGDFKNGGREYQPKGQPEEVWTRLHPELGSR
jgi:hypothetical protein